MRFQFSLVILIALLCFSTLLLLVTLVRKGASSVRADAGMTKSAVKLSSTDKKNVPSANIVQDLEDPALDFRLKIPGSLGNWMYRIGFVVSPVDEQQSNQYLKIMVPSEKKEAKPMKNFDANFRDVLTIRKYSDDEWKKLEQGCQKGNLFFCETAGEKVGEQNGQVYASFVNSACSDQNKKECEAAEVIKKSFQLN